MAASAGEVRSYLVHYFEEKVTFREKMAKKAGQRQRPWDVGKNDAYAKSLRCVAAHVAALPDDDPSLVALAECERLCDDYLGFQIPPTNGPAIWADRGTLDCGRTGKGMEPDEAGPWFTGWAASLLQEVPELHAAGEESLRKYREADDDQGWPPVETQGDESRHAIRVDRPAEAEGMQSHPPAGATGIQVDKPLEPWELPGAFRLDCEPHRGNLLWWMGAASVTCGLVPVLGLGGVALGLGLTTWYLARRDLAQMRRGLMDPSGERLTRDARDGSVVALVLAPLGTLYALVILFG